VGEEERKNELSQGIVRRSRREKKKEDSSLTQHVCSGRDKSCWFL